MICYGGMVLWYTLNLKLKGGTMTVPEDLQGLRFPCECVSARRGGYSDPWADITKRKLLPDGTKEEILNLVAREPKTISQLAGALNLSPPSVHTHINDMMKSELLRESEEWEKKGSPTFQGMAKVAMEYARGHEEEFRSKDFWGRKPTFGATSTFEN